jgi:hypothetical protein
MLSPIKIEECRERRADARGEDQRIDDFREFHGLFLWKK